MNLRHVEVFHAVMRAGTVTDAARLLQVSQPAVSKVLLHMEDQLGFALFVRSHGRMVPTAAAQALMPLAEKVVGRTAAVRRVAATLGEARDLRLAVTPALAAGVLPEAVRRFDDEMPGVSITVTTATSAGLIPSLLSRDLEIGFAMMAEPVASIADEELGEAVMVCLVPHEHALASAPYLTLADLDRHGLVGIRSDRPLGRLVRSAFDVAGLMSNPRITVDAFDMARQLCERGLAPAIVDPFTAGLADTGKVCVKPLHPGIRSPVRVMYLEQVPPSPVARTFIATFRSVLHDVVAGIGHQPRGPEDRSCA